VTCRNKTTRLRVIYNVTLTKKNKALYIPCNREKTEEKPSQNGITREVAMNQGNIDIHCHFFNFAFAFDELLEIGWRWLQGNYPYKSDEKLFEPKGIPFLPDELEGVVDYVVSLFRTLAHSPEENYLYEQKSYRESLWNPDEPLITVPLMMDIFFIIDNGNAQQYKSRLESLPAAQRKAALMPMKISDKEKTNFDVFAKDMKKRVIIAISQKNAMNTQGRTAMPAGSAAVAAELDQVIRAFKADMGPSAKPRAVPSGGSVQMTRGYRKHLEALRALRKKNPDTVFPFLALDPRRVGIEKLMRDQVRIDRFRGIKLYCPLGYLPSHPALHPIFKKCIERNIPITAHTSPGGLPSLSGHIATSSQMKNGTIVPVVFDQASFMATHSVENDENAHSLFFADPDKWLEVFECNGFEKLRVNFAHFGGEKHIMAYAEGSTDTNNWTGKIIRLMKRFENVYSDVSFCPCDSMKHAIETIMEREPVVRERLMFGTDYVMIMLLKCGLSNYFNHYKGINPDMLTTNPRKFLGEP